MFEVAKQRLDASLEYLSWSDTNTMAIFKAYFDESGTDDSSQILVVGGAVGEIPVWESVCELWAEVLTRYDVRAFHSADYNTGHGPFEGWEKQERHEFTDGLLEAVEKSDLRAIAYVMDKADFDLTIREFPKIKFSPYQYLSYALIIQTGRLTKVLPDIQPIEVIFEAGQKFFTNAVGGLMNDLGDALTRDEVGIAKISLQRKNGLIPFQIADLIVYELFKAHMRMIRRHPETPRYQATRLNRIMRGFAPKLSLDFIRLTLSAFEQ